MEQLDQWVQSPYSTPKVSAIYNYLKKACLIRELITEGVFQVDDRGKLLPKEKNSGDFPGRRLHPFSGHGQFFGTKNVAGSGSL